MPDPIQQPGGQSNAGGQSQPGASAAGAAGIEGSQQPVAPQSGQQPTGAGGNPASGAASAAGQAPAGTPAGGEVEQKTGEQSAAPAAPVIEPTWPTDWRQRQIKEAGIDDKDGKVLKQLERYASPGSIVKTLMEQQAFINSGKIKQPLAADATPEQKTAWRKENGIPELSTEYNLDLPDGLIIGEADKPILTPILESMHELNMTPDQVKGAVSAYKKQEAAFLVEREKQISDNHQKAEDTLRAEWGGEFRNEQTRINNLVATWSSDSQQAFNNGFDDKGMPLKDNINFMRDMAVLARTINPVSTIIPAGGGSQGASIDMEIAAIEKRISDDRDGYFKDQKMQDRYMDLLTWKDNQKARK